MSYADQNTFLGASDAARFIMFAVMMVLLLGSVGLASYMDQRKVKKVRARMTDRREGPRFNNDAL